MERIPTAKFPDPVLWLSAGTNQLHLFRPTRRPALRAHVSFDVDDFDALYAKAKEMGILDSSAFGSPLRDASGGLGAALPARPGREPDRGGLARREHALARDAGRRRRSSASSPATRPARPCTPLTFERAIGRAC